MSALALAPLGQRLRSDENGVTIVEFALIAPVLLLSVMGILDMGYNIYTQAMVRGAIQKAARDSTIQGASGNEAAIDTKVTSAVHHIVPRATLVFDRQSYANFSDVAQPEDFNDIDNDGTCNNNEPFEDANGNGTWDSDRGSAGFGGARDAVLYTVTVSYDRAFPLAPMIGLPRRVNTEATTVLRNQPYAEQAVTITTGNCT